MYDKSRDNWVFASLYDNKGSFVPMEEMNEIKQLRKGSGMTQKAFSEFFGIPVRTLQDWEAGVRTPPNYVVRLLPYKLKAEWDYENKRPKTSEPANKES